MATGPEMYDALKNATAMLPVGSQFGIHQRDEKDLFKLNKKDLISRGYGPVVAETVDDALLRRGDIGPLGDSMGLVLFVDKNALPLIP